MDEIGRFVHKDKHFFSHITTQMGDFFPIFRYSPHLGGLSINFNAYLCPNQIFKHESDYEN